MKDYGLVSIITPSYNCARFIGSTIESIQAQTYRNWELLVIDDCSDDRSVEVVKRYAAADPRIRLFSLPVNSGAGVARNNSIEKAQGRFIAFCDSDDRWYPEKLEKQLAFMREKDCGLSYTSYDVCDEDGVTVGRVKCREELNYRNLIRDNGIGCLTAMYDVGKCGKKYMPTIRKRQDWGLWLNIVKQIKVAYGMPQCLALYRTRRNSISSNKISMLKYNFDLYHSVEKFSTFKSASLLAFYFLPYYFYKKIKQKFDYKKQ